MKKSVIILVILWVWIIPDLKATTYYLAQRGDDANNGLSPQMAWKSIEKLNTFRLKAGDKVFFEGGTIFKGSILLDEGDAGNTQKLLTLASFGKGKAIIEAGDNRGIFIYNTGGIQITNLIVKGSGVGKNQATGIECLVDNPLLKLSNIIIDSCEVIGFHRYGILINADKNEKCGFSNIKISNCIATENGEAGIGSLAFYPSISHKNIHIFRCKAYKNRGILSKTDNHSGNGIVLSGVDKCIIESCEAYENGVDSRSKGGGPVGIWVWNCRNGMIQKCESHHNHAGLLTDGGGFDIDGGSSNCIIRNCYSHDNDGAGYLLCEFGSPLSFTNNIIENNISKNDGLKNGYGGISISGAGKDYPVRNCKVIGNKIFTSAINTVNNKPNALFFLDNSFSNILIKNNQFEVSEGGNLLRCDTILAPKMVVFIGNKYKTPPNKSLINCKKCNNTSENDWLKILK